MQEIAILPCIQEIVALLGNDSHIKHWNIDIKPDLTVYGSCEHIRILFENLISNQVKYGDSVSVISQSETKTHHIIKFYNDGSQIPEKIQQELFKPLLREVHKAVVWVFLFANGLWNSCMVTSG